MAKKPSTETRFDLRDQNETAHFVQLPTHRVKLIDYPDPPTTEDLDAKSGLLLDSADIEAEEERGLDHPDPDVDV